MAHVHRCARFPRRYSTTINLVSGDDGHRWRLPTGRATIAPPDFHLVLQKSKGDGEAKIRLTHGPKENRFRPAIDVLFRSAAVACGPRVIGVILTGALDDGAAGMHAIKECGGLAIVQDPLEAECPNMPINAMRVVTVDHVVPPRKWAQYWLESSTERRPTPGNRESGP